MSITNQPNSQRSSNLENNQKVQLETWTGMKMGEIIFDSNVDDWSVNTSVFDDKIMDKSNIIVIIEDEDGNKFGSCVYERINLYGKWIEDPKSFLFSFKPNQLLKFDIVDKQNAFLFYNHQNERLFVIGCGHDIGVYKKNYKIKSYCCPSGFNYGGFGKVLCGKRDFTPKRITVIQMI